MADPATLDVAFTPVEEVSDDIQAVDASLTPVEEIADEELPGVENPRRALTRDVFGMMSGEGRASPASMKMVGDSKGTTFARGLEKTSDAVGSMLGSIVPSILRPESIVQEGTLDRALESDDLLKYRQSLDKGQGGKLGEGDEVANTRKQVVDQFIQHFNKQGITDGKEMANVMRDAAKENVWAKGNEDPVRILSDGHLVFSPVMAAAKDPMPVYKAIQDAATSPEEKKAAEANFWNYRKSLARGITDKLLKSGEEGFKEHVAKKQAEGVSSPDDILYSWEGLDRNWIEKNWDNLSDAVSDAMKGIGTTIGRGVAGAAEAVGADKTSAEFTRGADALQEDTQTSATLGALRDERGGVRGTGVELGNSALQMAPMFLAGPASRLVGAGAEAGSIRLALANAVPTTTVYGWAGAQGYGSVMDTALEKAKEQAEAEGRAFTDADRVEAVNNAQGAAIVNGIQTAVMSKVLGQGVERAALGEASEAGAKMTLRDGISELAKRAKNGSFKTALAELKPDIKEMLKVAGHDIKDEALEEGFNQITQSLIEKETIDPNKDMGDAVDESVKSMFQGGFLGGVIPAAQSLLTRSPQMMEAEKMAVEAAPAAPMAAEEAAKTIAMSDAVVSEAPEGTTSEPTGSNVSAEIEAEAAPPLEETIPAESAIPELTEGVTESEIPGGVGTTEETLTPVGTEPVAAEPIVDSALESAPLEFTPVEEVTEEGLPESDIEPVIPPDSPEINSGSPQATPSAQALPYSKENLQATFNLSPEQAEASDAIVQAMGLDTSNIKLMRGVDASTPSTINQKAKGAVDFLATGDALLRGLTNPDISTALHEISHVARRTILNRDISRAAGITDTDLDTVENWAGVENGVWSVPAEEKFARGFERYMRDGEAPTPELQSIFSKIGDWMRNIYAKIRGTALDVQITPEMRALFDKLVTRGAPPVVETDSNTPTPPTIFPSEENISNIGDDPVKFSGVVQGLADRLLTPATKEGIDYNVPEGVDPATTEYSIKLENTEKERQRLGYPPRLEPVKRDFKSLWDKVMAAEYNWATTPAAQRPGPEETAGGHLLNALIAERDPERVLTDLEIAHLAVESLRRSDAVEASMNAIVALPEGAPRRDRADAEAQMQRASDEYRMILDFADRRRTASGRSLNAWKLALQRDYSLAAVIRKEIAATNTALAREGKPPITDLSPARHKELQAAVEKVREAEKARQDAEDEASDLRVKNAEQAQLIDDITRELEEAKAATDKSSRSAANRKKIKDRLAVQSAEAKTRLEAKGMQVLFQSVEDVDDQGLIAAQWLVDKNLSKKEFDELVAKTFGNAAVSYSNQIRGAAEKAYRRTARSVTGEELPTVEGVIDALDPEDTYTKQDVANLVRAHILDGKTGNDILDAVHADLEAVYPGTTREDVAKAFTDYGRVTYPSQDELEKQVRELRTAERIGLQISDIQAGRAPLKTGPQADSPSEQIRNLTRKRNNLAKENNVEIVNPKRQMASAQSAAKRRMLNEIEEMEVAIAKGEPRIVTKNGLTYTEDMEVIKTRLEKTRADYEKVFPKEPVSPEERNRRAMEVIDRQIAEEERLIEAGLLSRSKGQKVADSPEVAARRELLAEKRKLKRDLYEAENPGETALIQAKRQADAQLQARLKFLKGGAPDSSPKIAKFAPDDDLLNTWRALDAVNDQIDEIRRERPKTEEKIQRELSRSLARAEGLRDQLQRKLDNNDIAPLVKKETAAARDERIQKVRAEARAIRNQIAERQKEQKLGPYSDAAREKRQEGSLKKRITELERRKAEKDYTKKARPKPVTSAEINRLRAVEKLVKAELDNDIAQHAFDGLSKAKKLGILARDIVILRNTFLLGGDVGMLNRQMGMFVKGAALRRDAISAAKSIFSQAERAKIKEEGFIIGRILKNAARAFRNADTEASIYEGIIGDPTGELFTSLGGKFLDPHEASISMKEDVIRTNLLERSKWWVWSLAAGAKAAIMQEGLGRGLMTVALGSLSKPALLAVERANRTVANQARLEMAKLYLDTKQVPKAPKYNEQMTKAINTFTGRGSGGQKFESAVPLLNNIFLATRWLKSRVDIATLRPLFDVGFGRKAENREAAKQIAGMYGDYVLGMSIQMAVLSLVSNALFGDDDDEKKENGLDMNPFSTSFGNFRLGPLKINPFSGLSQVMGLMARVFGGKKTTVKGEKELTSWQKTGEILNFLQTKMNLNLKFALDTITGQYWGEDPRSEMSGGEAVKSAVNQAMTGLLLKDVERAYDEFGPVKGALVIATIYFGDGGSFDKLEKMTEEENNAK